MSSGTKRRRVDSQPSSTPPASENCQNAHPSQLASRNKQLQELSTLLNESAKKTHDIYDTMSAIAHESNTQRHHENLQKMKKHIENLNQGPSAELFPLKTLSMTFKIGTSRQSAAYLLKSNATRGAGWSCRITNSENFLSLHFACCGLLRSDKERMWTSICTFTLRSTSETRTVKTGRVKLQGGAKAVEIKRFMEWEEFEKIEGEAFVDVDIDVVEFCGDTDTETGKFDESQRKWADVQLIVQHKHYYVLKSMLGARCSFFASLFKSGEHSYEIIASPNRFLKFLEYIYGELAISDTNVENIIRLAKRFDAPSITSDCQNFLLSCNSQMSLVEKFRLAIQNGFGKLADVSIHQMETIQEIKEALRLNVECPTTMAISNSLTNKSIMLYEKRFEQPHPDDIN